MPVRKALAAALPALFLVASPAMAQTPAPAPSPCETAPVSEAVPTTPAPEDPSADSAPTTAAPDDASAESTINPDYATATSEGLVFAEQLAAIPPADCQTAPATTLPAPDLADALGDVGSLLGGVL